VLFWTVYISTGSECTGAVLHILSFSVCELDVHCVTEQADEPTVTFSFHNQQQS